MAAIELAYHQMFPEDGDPGWHAGQLPDGRRVHASAVACSPGQLHWAGSVEDPHACECECTGTCNLCLIRQDGGLASTRARDATPQPTAPCAPSSTGRPTPPEPSRPLPSTALGPPCKPSRARRSPECPR